MFVISTCFDVFVEAQNFYALQYLDFKTTGTRLNAEVKQEIQLYTYHLATALRDYLTLACVGEIRHAGGKMPYRIDGLYGLTRADAAVLGTQYEPIYMLLVARKLFSNFPWSFSYGGIRWGRIANAVLHYWQGKWNAQSFIDYAFDLYHNGGLAFDKGMIFGSMVGRQGMLTFLSAKSSLPMERWYEETRRQLHLASLVVKLLQKVQGIGAIGEVPGIKTYSNPNLVEWIYSPLIYGEERVVVLKADTGERTDFSTTLTPGTSFNLGAAAVTEDIEEEEEYDDEGEDEDVDNQPDKDVQQLAYNLSSGNTLYAKGGGYVWSKDTERPS